MLITRIIAIIMAAFQIVIPFAANKINGTEKYFSKWSSSDVYDTAEIASIEKKPNKDFVILNLTDCQLNEGSSISKGSVLLKNTVRELVEKTQPDLITLTGDNAWGYLPYVQLINLIDSFDIPWAPVFGNHDHDDEDPEWISYMFVNGENCLFKFGPEDMGYGNYVVNVTENGKVIQSLFFVDTHGGMFNLESGKIIPGYDQLEWYKWAVNGVQQYGNGNKVKSLMFGHIPFVEFNYAYNEAWNSETGTWRDGYEAFGEKNEDVCCASVSNGMFNLIKELGSTTEYFCGHDHVNDYSILYQGVRLTYTLKTGSGGYWLEDQNGGTKITIDSDGNSKSEHIYVNPSYKWNMFEPELWAYKCNNSK